MSQLGAIRPISAVTGVRPIEPGVLPDVFSQKVGNWAFAHSSPALHNDPPDIPSAFALAPVDGLVMDYLEDFIGLAPSLPMAHLYDSGLERVAERITDPEVKALLLEDIALRDYLRARKVGEVYE